MNLDSSEQTRSKRGAVVDALLTLSAALAIGGCASAHDVAPVEPPVESELAALMADGVLPSAMLPVPVQPPAPPRFCGGNNFPPPDEDAGVGLPPSLGSAGAASGRIGMPGSAGKGGGNVDGGVAADGGTGAVDPSCATVPIGFWRFNDCNPSRTDLTDSSFQSHTAFRNVSLACTTGQEGLAVAFSSADDLVYAPDQPDFGLDNGVTVAAWVKPDAVDGVRTIFRKRDDNNSAFALVINNGRFQFIIKLASGRMVSVSSLAKAGTWTHVAATYDGSDLRLYLNGAQSSQTQAHGVIAKGVGPLLMGNDAAGRRFLGIMDNAWFNTLAAPDTTILQLTCVHADPRAMVSPAVSDAVTAGTTVTYTLSITNVNGPQCAPANFINVVNASDPGFSIDPSFNFAPPITSGQTVMFPIAVTSGEETEAGRYAINFQVISQDGGGVIFSPSPISAVGPATPTSPPLVVPITPGGPVTLPPGPTPGGFTGNTNVQAFYAVAESVGCHVSSQRELTIRDVSVVDDPVRTSLNGPATDPNTGAWSFGRLMQRLSPTDAAAPDVAEAMFRSFLSSQTINTFNVGTRPPMDPMVLQPWPRTSDGKLDLARAPMLLLAIANRLDLKDLSKGKAGEGRLLYGVLDNFGNPLQFTVIFEYLLPANSEAEFDDWANTFHALQALPFPSETYNQALQAITDRFSARNAIPGNPNGSALIDIRTNEIALAQDNQWQLREFHVSPTTGFMDPATVFLTPDASFNGSDRLARFINANEAAVVAETHEVPVSFEGAPFLGGSVFNNIDFWTAPGINNPEARHKFSLNTCNGCHGQETQTAFLQVNPRVPGQASILSGFLNGETVQDPVSGQSRRLAELGRRRQLLESVVCATP